MSKEITLQDMKDIELNILDLIDKVCRENDLKYSLICGSLIGAIRHHGFIPWDDDIDICMPRPDYDKLIEIMNTNSYNNVKILSCETQKDYYYPFAKVVSTNTTMKEFKQLEIKDYGVFIDIFPVDGTYKSIIKSNIQMRKMKFLRKLLELAFHEKVVSEKTTNKVVKTLFFGFAHKIGYKKILNTINKISKKCKYENSEYATMIYSTISTNCHKKYKKEMFENLIKVKFEERDISIFADYDTILRDEFGDYMQLPPIEKQKSNHNFDRLEWK